MPSFSLFANYKVGRAHERIHGGYAGLLHRMYIRFSEPMEPETILFFVVGAAISLGGAMQSIKGIIRIRRSKTIWGEIVSFKKLPEKPRKAHEDPEAPDYFIEVKYEYEGQMHTTDSIIKKEIHYEKGGKIKIFLPNGSTESAIVDYNVVASYYVTLIMSLFIGLLVVYRSFFAGPPVDMSLHFPLK